MYIIRTKYNTKRRGSGCLGLAN